MKELIEGVRYIIVTKTTWGKMCVCVKQSQGKTFKGYFQIVEIINCSDLSEPY